jgi:DNA-binding MurR/RpiR family transcriptional regulator
MSLIYISDKEAPAMRLLKAMQEAERFSPTEQSVIDYIMRNPQEIAELSIRELAERTFTSPAAVFRLCQKFGLKGYNEFKIRFMSEMSRAVQDGSVSAIIRRPITDKDSIGDIVRKMAALEVEAIEETKNEMDLAQLERIARRMDKATVIDLYAYDQNYAIAETAVYNLLQVKRAAVAHNAMNSQFSQALISDKTHFALLISRSGENQRLMRTAKILKERHVPTALLSCQKDAPWQKYATNFSMWPTPLTTWTAVAISSAWACATIWMCSSASSSPGTSGRSRNSTMSSKPASATLTKKTGSGSSLW